MNQTPRRNMAFEAVQSESETGAVLAARLILACLLAALLGACGHTRPVTPIQDELQTTVKVKTALLNDTEADLVHVDVSTVDGVVTLAGVVSSTAAELRAVEHARSTDGVVDVVSRLRIADDLHDARDAH